MKDIVENRTKLSGSTKARLLALSVRENGLPWTALMGLYYLGSAIAEKAFAAADGMRRRSGLPGMNSPAMNRVIWNNWDWSAKGEEWTISEDWKRSVIETFLKPNVTPGNTVVEIGPGGGRWTGELQARAGRLIGIDISEACVKECRERFAGFDNVDFRVGNGADLAGVETASVDTIWSFDVFVHINRPQFENYVKEFARVLRPGGTGIIQHGAVGGAQGGWRSNVTADDVAAFTRAADLDVVEQVSSWHDQGHDFVAGMYDDVVTVFRKPV